MTQVPTSDSKIFELPVPFQDPWRRMLFLLFKPWIERLFALPRLQHKYEEIRRIDNSRPFFERALEVFRTSYRLSDQERARIPSQGPAIIVSNHPFGGIEGVILAEIIRTVRPDYKLFANFLLHRIEETRDHSIFVDPFAFDTSIKRNLKPLREAVQWIKDGGLLIVFPSGTVSHLDWQKKEISDPPWSPTVARIIRKTEAPVLPMFFQGTNGFLFQILGLIDARLRTAMLPRELLNKKNTTIEVNAGSLVPFRKLSSFERDEDMMSYLRLRTYILESRSSRVARRFPSLWPLRFSKEQVLEPLVAPREVSLLLREVEKLPSEQKLVESGEFIVYSARARQIPNVLYEIGRLREYSFRKAREGTGKKIDLDRFDNYYLHLFVWNSKKSEIVGAYRIGETDRILRRFGKRGLYTSTLFAYRRSLLEQFEPALELGRSFVRPEYQKNYSPLLLLWRGIGQFVVRNPRYKTLFGPVSINSEYESLSRQLIVQFLKANNYLPELAKFIKAKNPMRPTPIKGWDPKTTSRVVRDLEEISSLVAEIEADKRAVPILLRQYIKLGGKLLGFNVDPNFGDVLDGLILIDLTQTEMKLLERYLGKEGAQAFREYHRNKEIGTDVGEKKLPNC